MDAEDSKSIMHHFIQMLYQLHIKMLLAFSPATLFHKLSMLSWYSDTLHGWVGQHINGDKLRVLDVGCASGYLSEYLYQLGHSVSGIDSSESMIRAAQNRTSEINFKVGNACNLPYTDNAFDVVSSASLINIISDPSGLVEQMVRVCKPGGWITFLFPVSGFGDDDLNRSISSLGLSGFSKAALVTWHKSAPKSPVGDVFKHLAGNSLHLSDPKYYLNGMIASISARKFLRI